MLNKAMIIGNLGQDPEVKELSNGNKMAKFSIATSEKWKDKAGEQQEKTEWHRVTVFGASAANCAHYLFKGSKVYVEGKIETSQYEKDGETRYSTGIIAQRVQFLDSKKVDSFPEGAFAKPKVPDGKGQDFDDEIPF